ncbi:unnamed protein product [Spodoptera exigua]|nr:unnamed protein product [Spodoptera exigua]
MFITRSQLETEAGARPSALEVYGGEVLWADSEAQLLRACDKERCAAATLRTLRAAGAVLALRVYDAATQRAVRGPCAARASPCAHLCVAVSAHASQCLCATGYERRGDACIPVDEVVVFSVSWEVRGVALNASSAEGEGGAAERGLLPPVPQLSLASALAYDAAAELLFWADAEAARVWRVRRDGSGRALLAAAGDAAGAADWPAALAADWRARNLYWSDPRRALLLVARYDAAHRYVLLDTDPLAVTAMAIDPVEGWLFLAGGGWIERARLDGSQRGLLYNGSAVGDVAVDAAARRLYWLEPGGARLWAADYDGARRTLLAQLPAQRHHPVALAVYNATLYWLDTSASRGSVLAAPLANVSQLRVLRDNLGDSLKDIVVWARASQPAGGPCAAAGCEALCLAAPAPGPAPGPEPGAAPGPAPALVPRCVCPHGRLAANQRNCTREYRTACTRRTHCARSRPLLSAAYDSFLVYSRVTEIDTIHLLDEKDLNSPYKPIQDKELMRNAISLAYEYEGSRLFYSDIQRGSINTVHFNGSGHEVLLEREYPGSPGLGGAGGALQRGRVAEVGAVEGMVFAADSGTLYWTSTGGAAVRSARPGSLRAAPGPRRAARVRTVLRLGAGARPRGIDYEPCERRLYWTNWNESQPSIQRAYTSGRALQTVVATHILMPNGLALDHAAKKVYWADARLDKIERMQYDGSQRHVVTRTSTEHPFDLAVAGPWLYWTDWLAHGVFRADKRAGGATALRRDVPRPMAILAVLPQHQTCSSDPCATLNGGCAELCHMDAHGAAACSCGAGRELAPDGRACVPAAAACPAGQWGCAEGACIPDDLVCDGVPHCSDSPSASDEDLYYCTSRACGAGSVACGAGGRCVAAARACDGRADCDDGADEADCDCGAARYRCDDGACVPLAARCDRVQHCADGSDERDCPACLGPDCVPSDPTTTTTDSNAIETSTTETSREADEEEELCEGAQFRCGGGECVPLAWRCDGRADCPDGSDEATHCRRYRRRPRTGGGGACSARVLQGTATGRRARRRNSRAATAAAWRRARAATACRTAQAQRTSAAVPARPGRCAAQTPASACTRYRTHYYSPHCCLIASQ